MATTDELLDILMKDYKKPEDLIGENGLLKQLTKRLLERAMQAEMTDHLGYDKHAPTGKNSGNSRNGTSKKTVTGEFGNLDISVPRDRNSTFEPIIIPKGESRFTGFDDKIISMYARGMTTRDIQGHLQEIYGVDVSPTLISQVTDAISEEVKLWQNLKQQWRLIRRHCCFFFFQPTLHDFKLLQPVTEFCLLLHVQISVDHGPEEAPLRL